MKNSVCDMCAFTLIPHCNIAVSPEPQHSLAQGYTRCVIMYGVTNQQHFSIEIHPVNLRRGVLASTVPEKVHNLVTAEKWTVGATKWTLVEPFHDKGCCLIDAGS